MMRAVIGAIVGYAVWSGLWLLGNSVCFAEAARVVEAGEPFTEGAALGGVIGLSVLCSLAAGLAAAPVAGSRARGAVLGMAVLLLLTGIAVQAGVWNLMPVWYHLTFLALIVPVAIFGGRIAGSGRAAAVA